jgi:hypothetical protein
LGEEKKKKMKQKQKVILEEKSVESKKMQKLIEGLEEFERKKKKGDIQICPECKSHRVRRVGSMIGDMSGHMSLYPPLFECLDCGWRGRLVIKATNKKLGIKQVAIISEVFDPEKKK